GAGVEDGFPEVRFVGDDRLSIPHLNLSPEEVFEPGSAELGFAGVARGAPEALEEPLSSGRQAFARGASGEPPLVAGLVEHDDPAGHPGVLRPAVLRAEETVLARARRLEPRRRVAARQDVLLDPE